MNEFITAITQGNANTANIVLNISYIAHLSAMHFILQGDKETSKPMSASTTLAIYNHVYLNELEKGIMKDKDILGKEVVEVFYKVYGEAFNRDQLRGENNG